MCPEVTHNTPEKITSPRKSERLEKKLSPLKSGDEASKSDPEPSDTQHRKSGRLEKKTSPVKSEESKSSALDKENVPCSSQTLR